MEGKGRPVSPFTVLAALLVAGGVLIALAERGSAALLSRSAAEGGLPRSHALLVALANAYLRAKYHVLDHWVVYGALALFGPPLVYLGLRRLAAGANEWRERFTGMKLRQISYALAHPFSASPDGALVATQSAFAEQLFSAEAPAESVLLGFDDTGAPVHLSDRARTMHLHVLGQTGSGKTQSVLYPLLFQDSRRGAPLLFLDAKGSMENEEALAAIASATGRTADLRIFTLNPSRPTHTYNPLHLAAGSDPRAIAERVFSALIEV